MPSEVRRSARAELARPLGVLALLVVVAVGVSAARHAPPFPGVGVRRAGAVVTGIGVLVLLFGAAMTLAALRFLLRTVRRRRRGEDEAEFVQERHDTLSQRLGALLTVVVVIGLAVGLLFAFSHVHLTSAPHMQTGIVPSPAPTASPAPARSSSAGRHAATSGLVIALAGGAALVVAGAGAYFIVRARRPSGNGELDHIVVAEQRRPTADLLRDAAAALATPSDPRAAIVACYALMERRLADAGAPRRVADTPEELLGRAARSGLLVPASAEHLAGLFREARFSTHPMTEAHRTDAEAALSTLTQAVGRHG